MSNPYKRKALTLASSFVIAGTAALGSGAAIAADKPAAGQAIKSIIKMPGFGVTNPPRPGLELPRVIIKVPVRPPIGNPAPIRDLQKLRIKNIKRLNNIKALG